MASIEEGFVAFPDFSLSCGLPMETVLVSEHANCRNVRNHWPSRRPVILWWSTTCIEELIWGAAWLNSAVHVRFSSIMDIGLFMGKSSSIQLHYSNHSFFPQKKLLLTWPFWRNVPSCYGSMLFLSLPLPLPITVDSTTEGAQTREVL